MNPEGFLLTENLYLNADHAFILDLKVLMNPEGLLLTENNYSSADHAWMIISHLSQNLITLSNENQLF